MKLLALVAACGSPQLPSLPPPDPGKPATVARAREWSTARFGYCQAPNHTRDFDGDCQTTCDRQDNLAWDGYRSDCSGLVSYAWQLPAPGLVTRDFAPYRIGLTHEIRAVELRPGDAVNNRTHMMLFAGWSARPYVATFIEEPGCHAIWPYAREFEALVRPSDSTIIVFGKGRYTAIRNDDAP